MFSDDLTCLRHMRDAAKKAIRFSEGKKRADLDSNEMLTLSLVKCIEIIGEAALRVAVDQQNQLSQIPWDQIIGMRNRLIHAYFQVDLDTVWNTVNDDLPDLILELERAIETKELE